MHFLSIPAAVGSHHGHRSRFDALNISREMQPPECGLVHFGVSLVFAVGRSAVSEIVFYAGKDRGRIRQSVTLQSLHVGCAECFDKIRVFPEALVRSAPLFITSHCNARGECPLNTGAAHLSRSQASDTLYQRRISGCTKSHIMRCNDSSIDIVVTMDGIDAEEQRNFQSRLLGKVLVRIVDLHPRVRLHTRRLGVATPQNRSERIGGNIAGPFLDRIVVDLSDLPDLFF